jgi:hypothetical protein
MIHLPEFRYRAGQLLRQVELELKIGFVFESQVRRFSRRPP